VAARDLVLGVNRPTDRRHRRHRQVTVEETDEVGVQAEQEARLSLPATRRGRPDPCPRKEEGLVPRTRASPVAPEGVVTNHRLRPGRGEIA